jgi:transcription antitermination factor NusG
MMADEQPASASSERWYAFSALPHQEATAEANLQRQGLSIFIPRLQVTTRHAGRFRSKLAWFFPRYGFVSLDIERQRWRNVNGTYGVASLVMSAERPLAVPAGIVEGLRAISDEGGIIDPDRGLSPGGSVELVAGPFSGMIATLVRLDGHGRAELLLTLLGGPTRVTVARDVLIPMRQRGTET